ncbi:hypothetical protein KC340_g16960 [Hortaea werneckii]|nr:hypothetical protein KC342_g8570 [Hortaea werneckii]KAI7096062.1 hypothetical protein KC339_g10632 [Hortaea werneckii]KAI7229292.1 hypothetical protein KC365_g8089 [Hortaea werneckii]KAI7291758.1 hypothetical protein KC340_g16960 [Hortaea werneckii]KAI7395304.1 hypothetical protein KC328_g5778 [Hortaea werneckii]
MTSKSYSWALVLREALGEKVQKFIDAKIQLMDLLPEIRQVILEHLCEETTIPVFLRGNGYSPATGIKLPVTARLGDMVLRQETIRTALEKATFRIDSFPGNQAFQAWLEKVDLRQVSSTYADHPNSDIELMLKCRNLETVKLTWATDVLYHRDRGARTVDRLRKEFRLDRMLGLTNLKQLTLNRDTWEGERLLRDLADWFRDNLVGSGGKGVEVLRA